MAIATKIDPVEKKIWNTLMDDIGNPYGVAGVMGNLYSESSLNPSNLEGSFEKKLKMNDDEYTKAVDEKRYLEFDTDRAGYGLAQWTYPARKQALRTFAEKQGTSIADPVMQTKFILKELKDFPAVTKMLKNCTSVKEASDAFMTNYEMPKDVSDEAKRKREMYGERYFERHKARRLIVTGELVYIRMGDGPEYQSIGHVRRNEEYDIVAVSDQTGWYAIRPENATMVGWISNKWAEVIN